MTDYTCRYCGQMFDHTKDCPEYISTDEKSVLELFQWKKVEAERMIVNKYKDEMMQLARDLMGVEHCDKYDATVERIRLRKNGSNDA